LLWRKKVATWVDALYQGYKENALAYGQVPVEPFTHEDMPSLFGKRWAYQLRDEIMATVPFLPFNLVSHFINRH
jgi:hypothetical protein